MLRFILLCGGSQQVVALEHSVLMLTEVYGSLIVVVSPCGTPAPLSFCGSQVCACRRCTHTWLWSWSVFSGGPHWGPTNSYDVCICPAVMQLNITYNVWIPESRAARIGFCRHRWNSRALNVCLQKDCKRLKAAVWTLQVLKVHFNQTIFSLWHA